MEEAAQPRIRILLVDDHPIVRKGLAATISPEPDMEVAGTAASGREAIDLFRRERPDITIMDLNLTPEMTGAQAIKAIKSEFPEARIIVLSAFKGDEDIYRAFQAGAVTYLLKDSLSADLIPIIREVHAGGGPIPSDVGRKLADRVRQPVLTSREVEVLQLIAKGMRNKEIGSSLCISEETVQGHVKSLLSKLKVHDRTEAVIVGIRRGLVRIV
jgi:two-component system NarL family response regulator